MAGIEFYISIIGPQSSSEHVYLGLTDIGLREGHLPGQVTALDHVIVHQSEITHSGRGEILRQWHTQSPCAHNQHAR